MPPSTINVLNVQPDDIVMGGVQMRSISVGECLLHDGIRTDILVARNGQSTEEGPVSRAARERKLNVFSYSGIDRPRRVRDVNALMHNLKWMISFPLAVVRVCRIISQSHADIVHVNGLLNMVPAFASRVMGRQLVWNLIGDHYPKTIVSALRPIVRSLSHHLVFEAESMKQFYFENTKLSRSSIIHEPVDLSRFVYRDDKKEELLEEFGIHPSQTIVGAVGNIVPSKGWVYFLDAADQITQSHPSIHFLIIGAESDTQAQYAAKVRNRILELGLEDRVTLTGYRRDVEDLLALLDIFMMASLNEGTPLAILEAMATGTPVIATDVGGISEQVIDGETGILLPPKDSGALVKACRYLLSNAELQKKLGKAGYEHVKTSYSLKSCVRKHRELYEKVVFNASSS